MRLSREDIERIRERDRRDYSTDFGYYHRDDILKALDAAIKDRQNLLDEIDALYTAYGWFE